MSDNFFLDTNIFIYSFDPRDRSKQKRAIELIADALTAGSGIISTQVMQEFLNVATQKFEVPLTLHDSVAYLKKVLNPLCQVFPDLSVYEACLQIQAETQYSFYDSLILASAIQAGCQILYTVDMQDGQKVRGIQITNPFITRQRE